MKAGYGYWLFDLDGTLVDVECSYIREVIDEVGELIDHSFSEEQAVNLWRAIGGPPEAQLRAWGIEPETFWEAFHAVEDPETRVDATFLYPDAAVIAGLDCPIGVVTHCQSYITEPVLEELDIADWFDTVVCCHDEIGWKPDPRPVERAIRDLQVAGDCTPGVLAGDTAADVGAAWNAGLDGIHIERFDPVDRGMCVRADQRIGSFDEILAQNSAVKSPATSGQA